MVLILENLRELTPHACISRWSSAPAPAQRDFTNAVEHLHFTKHSARFPAVNLWDKS